MFLDFPKRDIRAYDTVQAYLAASYSLKDAIGRVVPHPRGYSLRVYILQTEVSDEIVHALEEYGEVRVNSSIDSDAQRKQPQAYEEPKRLQETSLPAPKERMDSMKMSANLSLVNGA